MADVAIRGVWQDVPPQPGVAAGRVALSIVSGTNYAVALELVDGVGAPVVLDLGGDDRITLTLRAGNQTVVARLGSAVEETPGSYLFELAPVDTVDQRPGLLSWDIWALRDGAQRQVSPLSTANLLPRAYDPDTSGTVVITPAGRLATSLTETMADLRETTGYVGAVTVLEGFYAPRDGGGGIFWWEDGVASGDDGGTLIVPTSATGRWVRLFEGAYNVRWFGAYGDDTHDDTTVLQAVFDLVGDLTGGASVFFPVGVYRTSKTLVIRANTEVFGEGADRSIIRTLGGGGLLDPGPSLELGTDAYAGLASIGAEHVVVRDLMVDHQTNNTHANGIIFVPDGNPRACTFDAATEKVLLAGHGIPTGRFVYFHPADNATMPDGLNPNVNVYWITVDGDSGRLATTLQNALDGIYFSFGPGSGSGTITLCMPYGGTPCTDCRVEHNEVHGANYHEYLIWSMNAQRQKILANTVDGFFEYADFAGSTFQQEGIEVYGGVDVQVIGNLARRIGNAGFMLGQADGVDGTQLTGLVCEGNIAEGCGRGFFIVAASGLTDDGGVFDAVVSGNVARNSYHDGIGIRAEIGGAYFKGLTVEGNLVDVAGQPAAVSGGLWMQGFSRNVVYTADSGTDTCTAVGHGLTTGQGPWRSVNSGGALPDGITALLDTWVIALDDDHFQFAASYQDALALTPIPLSSNGTGVQTLLTNPQENEDVVVRGNTFRGVRNGALAAMYIGLFHRAVFEKNRVESPGADVQYLLAVGDGLRFAGNHFEGGDSTYGITFNVCRDLDFADNTVSDHAGGTPLALTSACMRSQVHDNLFDRWPDLNLACIIDSGAYNSIVRNRFYREPVADPLGYDAVISGGDAGTVEGNRQLYDGRSEDPFGNLSTNANFGTAAATGGVSEINVTSTRFASGVLPRVQQRAGNPLAFRVSRITGPDGFKITLSGLAVGNETFYWELP